MLQRHRAPFHLLMFAMAMVAILSAACKKNPPAATSTPEPPSQQVESAAEPVNEQPMNPVVEEPRQVGSMGADAYNQQGLLKAVYFDFDKYDVRPDQRPTLQANADKLKTNPLSAFHVLIEGHTDERGTNEYNMTLGDRRANAVKQYLISLGVSASRLRTISYGEERASDPGHGEEAWAKNRRSEFVLEEG